MTPQQIAEASAWFTWLVDECSDEKRAGFVRWIMESSAHAQAFADIVRVWEEAGKARPFPTGGDRG